VVKGVKTLLRPGAALGMWRFGRAVRSARKLENDWQLEAAHRAWENIVAEHGDKPVAYAGYASVLRKMNNGDASREILAKAIAQFPDDLTLALERTLLARHQGRLEEALSFARDMIARFPAAPQGYESAARTCVELGRLDEAEAVLATARGKGVRSMGLASEYAVVADVGGKWDEALARWQAASAAYPNAAMPQAGLGAAFKRLKRFDEADAVLSAAMARFPKDSNLAVNYGWVADDRGDWQAALERWQALRARFPRNPRVRTGLVESQAKARLLQIDAEASAVERPPAAPDAAPAALDDLPHRDLFTKFESLGENCELGFAQQHFGSDTLGLLRWAGISLEKLLYGLETNFEGVGSAESTELHLNPRNHEYHTTDKVFGLGMHTFITRDEGNEEKILRTLRRRMLYLKNKLLDDLKQDEKIFVYMKQSEFSQDEMVALHEALRRHGASRLLCVRLADEAHPPGTFEIVRDGLGVGYIDRYGYRNDHWDVSFDIWLKVCQQAAAALQ
jgi:tetratricopeptide (TPR) repeat protein